MNNYDQDKKAKNYMRLGFLAALPAVVSKGLHFENYMALKPYMILNIIFIVIIIVTLIFLSIKVRKVPDDYRGSIGAAMCLIGSETVFIIIYIMKLWTGTN